MEEGELPPGWGSANVGLLGNFINGCAFKPKDWVGRGTPIVRIQNLTDASRPLNTTDRVVDERYVIERGDILVSWSATLDVFKWSGPRAYVNQHIFKVVTNTELDVDFVFFALKESIQELIHSEHLHGTTMKHINRGPFLAHSVRLPPLNEQRRIVDKIETLFVQLDKAEEAVRQVQALLKRYRQSILRSAVTGGLTADWRARNTRSIEHGRDLLVRILKTRRETWKGRGQYTEPAAADTTDLPELPQGWVWASVGQLAKVMGGLTKNKKRREMPLRKPMLRVANVYQNRLELEDVHETGVTEGECARVLLEDLDLLVVEGNGSRDQIGRMAVWRNEIPDTVHQNHLIKVRMVEKGLVEFALWWFQSPTGRHHIEQTASSTSGLYTLSISKIEALVVPVPSLVEMEEINARVYEALSKISYLESWCRTELARASALRQSVLKAAFAGRLVPQDPDDEPAAAILARIKSAAVAKSSRRSRKSPA